MSRPALVEYLKGLWGLYKKAPKRGKTELLAQAENITGKSRRTIQRYLAAGPDRPMNVRIEGRGRNPVYPAELLVPHVRVLWKKMEMISAERMVQALPKWLPFYKDPMCSPEVRDLLLAMSRCTLERLLAEIRRENVARRGLSTTTSGLRALKAKIPINTLDRQATRPGFTQADTVAHCGSSAAGQFINSLTLTDLYSGWTLNRALPGKRAIEVRRCFVEFKKQLPFNLLAVNTDSGSEFINAEIFGLMTADPNYRDQNRIQFTRSRPYRKNDNAYVEQRNYTHVRQLFGYYRFEDPGLVVAMNEIYERLWNPLHNFFLPSQKLIEKTRVGARIVKKHDRPQTPAERLLASGALTEEQKAKIRDQQASLDPFTLAEQLERHLQAFFEQYRRSTTQKEAA